MAEQLRYTAAHSSRINRDNPLKRRATESPIASLKRQRSVPAGRSIDYPSRPKLKTFASEGRLDDNGLAPSLLPATARLTTVLSIMQYVQDSMFTPMPDRATGMSSTRVAEVLNFRARLPPIVSTAHIQALSRSPTTTEREMATMCSKGKLRRIHIPLRGKGAAAVGEGVVLVADWFRILGDHPDLNTEVKDRYIAVMKAYPTSLHVSSSEFSSEQALALTQAGFLTAASMAPSTVDRFISASAANSQSRVLLPSQISQAPSGSLAAVGGSQAFLGSGGGSAGRISFGISKPVQGGYQFSLPNTGQYLETLVTARTRLLDILSKSSPKFKEMPQISLEDVWNGGVPTGTTADEGRKERGDQRGLMLPGKTKKWRQFHGLSIQWVLEECVGSGLVELFGTGSVGAGVRAT